MAASVPPDKLPPLMPLQLLCMQREAAAAAAAAASDSQSAALAAPEGKASLSAAEQQQAQAELLRQRQQQLDRVREDPFAAILAARSALQHSEKFVMKSLEVAHGGAVPDSGNQLLLGDDGDGEVTTGGPHMTADMDGESMVLQQFTAAMPLCVALQGGFMSLLLLL